MNYAIKMIISAVLVVLISEIGKRYSFWGAILASLPTISILAFVFLYTDTGDTGKVIALSTNIFWLVIPSLVLFISLPVLLKKGLAFYPSLGLSMFFTVIAYFVMSVLLKKFGLS